MSLDPKDYICAITAKAIRPAQMIEDADDDDDFEGAPLHLVRVTVESRSRNPKYDALVSARERQIEGVRAQIIANMAQAGMPVDESTEAGARNVAQAHIDAEAAVDLTGAAGVIEKEPRYVVDSTSVYVDPQQAGKAWREILKTLGITDGEGA